MRRDQALTARNSPYELRHSAEGLVKHLPADEAARLIAARFDVVNLSEDAVHALALNLAITGLEESRPMVRKWAENTAYRKKHVAPDIAACLYGDVRPWAEQLQKKQQVDGILRSAGWLGRGASVLYCECGYPTRIQHSFEIQAAPQTAIGLATGGGF